MVHKLALFVPVQLAPIGQNNPGEQLLCANTLKDNDSSETTHNKIHINVLVAIAETMYGTLAPTKLQVNLRDSRAPFRVNMRLVYHVILHEGVGSSDLAHKVFNDFNGKTTSD